MELSESKEDYLEAIYILKQKYGHVRNAMLCDYMNYSKSSISVAMRVLSEDGYVIRSKYDGITLTPEGEKIAKKVYERHLLLKEYLEELGISKEQADIDACRMEHVVSDETCQCLQERMDEIRRENEKVM